MKKNLSTLGFGLFIALFAVSVLASCNNDDEMDNTPSTPTDADIAMVAAGNENFTSLVAALQKADLVDALKSPGPYTVFAPTNEAFSTFLADKGFDDLNDVPEDILTAILLNHVVEGEVKSTDLKQGYISTLASEASSQNELSIYVDLSSGVVINGSSMVTTPDVEASNGVIHVIDAVIDIPSVVTHALSNDNFTTLVSALTANGLSTDFVSVLSGAGPFTVFAPTNAAFEALLNSNPDWNSLGDIPTDILEKVLTYHVIAGANVLSSNLADGMKVTALSGDNFTINIGGDNVTITDANGNIANIIAVDVQAGNGVIHVLDKVILP
jgi:uncharacterized surface protein with fasciclin (FAS1) repeats